MPPPPLSALPRVTHTSDASIDSVRAERRARRATPRFQAERGSQKQRAHKSAGESEEQPPHQPEKAKANEFKARGYRYKRHPRSGGWVPLPPPSPPPAAAAVPVGHGFQGALPGVFGGALSGVLLAYSPPGQRAEGVTSRRAQPGAASLRAPVDRSAWARRWSCLRRSSAPVPLSPASIPPRPCLFLAGLHRVSLGLCLVGELKQQGPPPPTICLRTMSRGGGRAELFPLCSKSLKVLGLFFWKKTI